jgi:hypothetical protein
MFGFTASHCAVWREALKTCLLGQILYEMQDGLAVTMYAYVFVVKIALEDSRWHNLQIFCRKKR